MVDLHTHLLPKMDDGARSVEEAVKMTELLYEQGIQAAACTPHFDPSGMALEDFVNQRNNAMNLMGESRIPLIPASETYLHEALFYYSSIDPLCIDHTNYLLLELPFTRSWDDNLYSVLEKLMFYFDVIPLIAHIEQYPATRKNCIKRLKNMGCVIQLNTSSVLEKKLKHKALNYIRIGLVDVLGSDCHGLEYRPPQFQNALNQIGQQLGNQYLLELANRSDKLMKGLDIRG